ncbi:MAG: hypothetical protein JW735_09200, partial [Prolixibacteraceae bacterium]|nr:hypothetical protein [Prolixibacteraceae bacterium]
MGVTSTQPTSRRGYLSQSELEQMANITVTNATEADDRISQAEEMLDAYVGPQDKYMDHEVIGIAAAGASTSITLETSQQNTFDIDYFKLCDVEILGGTGAGQRRKCTGSTKAGVLTVDTWTTTPSTDSFYRITQVGKFPRRCDVETYTSGTNTTYYKSIPEAIKRAVAAQIEYIIEMGDAFFAGDKPDMQSESIGDYSYTKGEGISNISKLIAPKAKVLLKGIYNRTGQIIA